jgi:hypothetical protein
MQKVVGSSPIIRLKESPGNRGFLLSIEALSVSRPAPGRRHLTAQGHPRAVFQRAIERGNLLSAESAAREMGRVTLMEALELTALVALRDRERASRFATRWLRRFLEEHPATIEEAALVASALAALGGPAHNAAAASLVAMTEQAIRKMSSC